MCHARLIFIVTALLCLCCSKKETAPEGSPAAPASGENAMIDDALKAQLEALGYRAPENDPASVSEKDNPYANVDLSHFLEGGDATFVFYDMQHHIEIIENEARAKTPFPPQSTFKIPNTLIALDTGVAPGPEMVIEWDSKRYPKEPWWDTVLRPMGVTWDRNHTLGSAFQHSCVWYYREIAKRVGEERMQSYLNRFDYGNKDISGGIDRFWLESSLKISAVEQIAFLKKLVDGTLPIREETRAAGFKVFERERKEGRVLYAKTGGGSDIGWFVGIVENGDDHYLFALNMAGPFAETAKKRVDLSIKMLQELGVWL